MTRRKSTIRATIFGADDKPIEVEAEHRPGQHDYFDVRFGNWLPGDREDLTDVRRVDGEDFEPGQEVAAIEALWNAVSMECDE